jgi:hypothetical protein
MARTTTSLVSPWQFALVPMAYGEVLSRIGVLQVRRIRAERHPVVRSVIPAGVTGKPDAARQAA